MGKPLDIESRDKGSPAVSLEQTGSRDDNPASRKGAEPAVGRAELSSAIPPDDRYEGKHRWDPLATWTPEEERAVVRKTDIWLLSWLCVMFFGLQLDRGNLSNALADKPGLLHDLHLSRDDLNNGNTIQLLAFLAAEFPVQLLTKRYGFRCVLPAMMFAWGTVSWAQAWMHDRAGFYVTRALIGACEGGFIPGAILYATYFYKSAELSTRLAVFWSTLNVARVISALLAAGILEMRGTAGKPGWFWLFLLEGLLTVVLAFISFIYLPASPTKTSGILFRKPWYTERQEVIMINRILRDDPAKGLTLLEEPATWQDIKSTWMDPSLWGLYFIGLIAYIPATPVQGYITLTLGDLGFKTFDINMLTIPSAVLQIITMLILARSSRYFNERTFHCMFGEFWVMPLLIALITLPDGGREWGRYSLVTLISGYPYFHPIVTSWISENTFDVKKRAIAAATYNVIVQVGSLIGSQIYRDYQKPYYKIGNISLVSIAALALITFLVQRVVLVRLNEKKEQQWDQMSREERQAYQDDVAARELDGNKRLDFRFQRKIGSRSCDGCKIRKVKCTETTPCQRCVAAGIECTFNTTQSQRGPRSLRARTLQQIRNATTNTASAHQTAPEEVNGTNATRSQRQPTTGTVTPSPSIISIESLVVRLCIYRLRLFPVWPIVSVEEIIAALHRDTDDVETYTLAVAIGAATVAQLKLSRFKDPSITDNLTATDLETECQRTRGALSSASTSLSRLQTSFFLHIYHENQVPGGTESLLYLREAISLAQIMGLHRPSSYLELHPTEDRLRRRILWLLFVTERGVAMLHRLPVVLTSAEKFPPLDNVNSGIDEGPHVLPAFKKLVNLFWIFDQSRALAVLQDAADDLSGTSASPNHEVLRALQKSLRDAHLGGETEGNDIQKADISITRQWMQILIWRATQGHSYWRIGDNSSASVIASPIQIAQELLDDISKLPNAALEAHGPGIEFKVFEIASAVADSLNFVNANPGDILLRLQRFLATSRGGNINLLGLLSARIAQREPSPSYSINMHRHFDFVAELEHQSSSSYNPLTQPMGLLSDGSLASGDALAEMLRNQDWLLTPGSPKI
ncbi:major facilitator superfamily domain-containing protein [Podospora australis]|uniref:Major facilitator superfamily domain-containing protein n=1 Tax=Podospora australis TaxID=1536484 RepID=A0AAN6WZF4_9PEZI|nr:major facilitator superfamily domain-containing protein [Podospora australis]